MEWQPEKFHHESMPMRYWVHDGEICWESDWIFGVDSSCSFLDAVSQFDNEEMYEGYEKTVLAVSSFLYEDGSLRDEDMAFKFCCTSGKQMLMMAAKRVDVPESIDDLGISIDDVQEMDVEELSNVLHERINQDGPDRDIFDSMIRNENVYDENGNVITICRAYFEKIIPTFWEKLWYAVKSYALPAIAGLGAGYLIATLWR